MRPHLRGRRRSRRPGLPLAVYLLILVLIPVFGAFCLAGVVVSAAVNESDGAARAEAAVSVVAGLERARVSVQQEVIPVLTLAAVRSDEVSAVLGLNPVVRALGEGQASAAIPGAREASDEALRRVLDGPRSEQVQDVVRGVVADLAELRAATDAGSVSVDDVLTAYHGYVGAADTLGRAQTAVGAVARDQDVSTGTREAVADLALIARVSQTTSFEVPAFIGTVTVFTSASVHRDATQARSDSRAAQADLAGLAQPQLVAEWQRAMAVPEVQSVDQLLDSQLDLATPALTSAQTLALLNENVTRSATFTGLLNTAADLAQSAAADDRRAADTSRNRTVELGLGLLALSVAAAAGVGRSVSGSLRRLAGQAQEVSRGALVDVDVTGAREVRTVSTALRAAVASLRRIQDQAGAVARGDLADPSLDTPLEGPLGEVVHASVQQIVQAVRQREELQTALTHQATRDALTELPNRAEAVRLTAAALRGTRGVGVGLLFIDLDGFKAVNDTLGHGAGDQLLRVVARRLEDGVRAGDVVCRLGGDEFVVVVESASGEQPLLALARRLIDSVSRPMQVNGSVVSVGASVGVALNTDPGMDGDELLAQADAAVYRAKRLGRGRAEMFDETLRGQLAQRADLQAAIGAGLTAGEMRLHYQPVFDVASRRLVGFEALLRWDRPGHGVLAPGAFLDAAEGSRLIDDLGRWALHEAARQLAEWRERPGPARADEPTVAVNLSGRHVSVSRVVTDVTDALAAAGLPAELLVVEVTETVLVDEPAAFAHLATLRGLGVSVAIDDFGTGYTSIGQLRNMPVDTVKIDRSFVASDEPSHRTLVTLMVQAAHAFGLTVVAEGVEEQAQLDWLQDMGCNQVQGYLLARPMPAGQVRGLFLAVPTPVG